MYSLERRVGRLLEIRFRSPLDKGAVGAFATEVGVRTRDPGARVVSCVDMRSLRPLPPDVSDAFVDVLRGANPRIERTACLLPEASATLRLQIERLHREAGNPARRTFRDAGDLRAWLGEVLDLAERRRLADFLSASIS
jgi:hypothetical protein